MRVGTLLTGTCIGLASTSSALGDAHPYYAQVPISAAALAADPSLANYNCWDVRVTVSGTTMRGGPDRFGLASFDALLSIGNFYSPPGGGDIPVAFGAANLAYDTFVTIPGFQVGMDPRLIAITGSSDLIDPGSTVAKFPRAGEQQSQFSAVWGDPTFTLQQFNGDFLIARLTVSKDAVGPVLGYVGSGSSNLPQFAPAGFFSNGLIVVPEPAVLGIFVIAATFAHSGRRRDRDCISA